MTLSARAPLCIGLAVIGLWGCNPAVSPSTPTTTSTPDSTPDSTASAPQPPTADSTNVEKNQYSGPPVTLDVLQLESHPVQHVAEVTVTVPTGGWTINLDKAEIKGGVAERPDQFVTRENSARILWTLRRDKP